MAGNAAQIIGRVNPDLSVKVYNALDLGNDVGMLLSYISVYRIALLYICVTNPEFRP